MKKKGVIKWEELEFKNVNWKRVLKEIVDYAPNRYGRGKRGYEKIHPLVKQLKITPYELMLIMAFLEEQGLIEYDKQEQNWIIVTSKGFDVALQNQNTARTEKISKAAIFLSLVVAITALLSLLSGIENLSERYALSGIFIIAIVIGGYFIIKSK